ncbi:hypothetical protein EYF80_006600 [Liparis tanakae]|uniref:Uncharacterized protein n=1 Tax=Liparis tanakae TaxID=230148 RepID=A0A4Z2J0K8_9TELE|nr:hypothetical protein EYF80_006600 [Liparis tanakae]
MKTFGVRDLFRESTEHRFLGNASIKVCVFTLHMRRDACHAAPLPVWVPEPDSDSAPKSTGAPPSRAAPRVAESPRRRSAHVNQQHDIFHGGCCVFFSFFFKITFCN